MVNVYKIDGLQLQAIRGYLKNPDTHTLRIMVDAEGVKVKFNQGPWSPPLGELEGSN
ncbi:hypothetical protein PBI_ROPE_51 [Mycobacterium phage Rope]|uniref:Uncharacterized protein n=1 Tax=Mycobacterium phage Rope TaxID=2767563 RepID=A0A7G9V0A6_9CAUD|nr:hypothetical protein PBI_ROPE_51 [Mycobacterium phage Rope]